MSTSTNVVTPSIASYKKKSQGPEIWRRFKKNKRAVVGLVIITCFILAAIFAEYISPNDPAEQDISNRLQSSSAQYPLGTDQYGRCILTRIIYGARVSLSVGIFATVFAVFLGGAFGATAGYYGGITESIIMRCMDVLLSIPPILLNIAVAAALGGGIINTMIAIGISNVPQYCRIMRSTILSVRNEEFIEASRAAGASDLYIILQHIIPNCMSATIIQATLKVGRAILTCATLSFIGLGVSPPTPEWGSMIAAGREYLRSHSIMTTYPGIAIMLTVYSLNLMGDGLRDALDPKLKD